MKEQEEELWNQEAYVTQSQEVTQKKKKSKAWLFVVLFIALIGIWDAVTSAFIDKYLDEKREVAEQQESTSQSREEVIKQQALDYLKERYGEEFVIESYIGQGYAYDYINMYAYPKEHQDEAYKFKLQGRYNEKGALEFTDSYVMIKLRDDYEAYVDPIIDEYFDEYKFYMDFDSEWIMINIPADSKLEDLWELKANEDYPLPWLTLYLKSSEKENYTENMLQKLSETLQKSNYRGVLSIRIYYDNSYYDKRNRTNLYENIGATDNDVDGNTIIIYREEIKY